MNANAKKKSNDQLQVQTQALSLVWYEQLANHRLKPPPKWRRRLWRVLARSAGAAWALFKPVELRREVAPGQRALSRHEWEQVR